MPYYIGDVIKDEKRLIARTPEAFRQSGIDVRINAQAEEADPVKKTVRLSDNTIIPYDFLVIGTGAGALLPQIPGIEMEGVFTMKNLPDALRMKAYLKEKQCRRAVIVGAGFIAMEMAEALRTIGMETIIVHRGELPANRWDKEFSKVMLDELVRNNVSFLTNRATLAVHEGKESRLRIETNQENIETDMVLFALGIKPNVKLATDMGVKVGTSGAIQVNFSQATNIEGVYAVGDCCEVFHRISRRWVHMPLGDIANKQGRTLGRNIGGGKAIFPGVVGAQSFKLFNLEVAATGIDEKEAVSSGYLPASATIWGNAIAASMPGIKKLGIRMVADRASGKLLGAQAVGEKGAVSRINALSCALWAGMDLDDIAYLDLAYAPPFGGAWDIIHTAAQVLKKNI
jgi:NADPH-dependent 2,4-dienoyl-CoA reductase/sulfur reductase-like enzyme